ncbi:MAG TPA: DUF4142 domain-containing protein [Burkholderiaceae bacterium]
MTFPAHLASRIPTKSATPSRTVLVVAAIAGFCGALLFATSANAADLARADKNFLQKAAEANAMEIAASRVALEKATSPAVKDFANMMITEHTKTGDELRALANAKGVKVPEDPSVMQKAKLAVLGKLNGANFDKQYTNIVAVSAHKDTVELFRKNAEKAKDADVKQFAVKTLPALEHHMQMAQQLNATTDGKAGATAAMTGPTAITHTSTTATVNRGSQGMPTTTATSTMSHTQSKTK